MPRDPASHVGVTTRANTMPAIIDRLVQSQRSDSSRTTAIANAVRATFTYPGT
jgi:hypothetical protein